MAATIVATLLHMTIKSALRANCRLYLDLQARRRYAIAFQRARMECYTSDTTKSFIYRSLIDEVCLK